MSTPDRDALAAQLEPFGQVHLLAFWDQLNSQGRARLAQQIEAIDFAEIASLWQQGPGATDWGALAARATSPPAVRRQGKNAFAADEARAAARAFLDRGKLGVILVAGGQGTRLGFDHPKGTFPIGPVSGASLFRILLEKIVALSERHGVRVPLYLMTSSATHDETIDYLEEHARFGLPKEDVRVFCQGSMPAVDLETGRVLLEAPDQIALGPDGHGGMLAALSRSGGLADAQTRGIEQFFYLQIDNPLVAIGGEDFLGYHLLAGSELSTQVIVKREPEERVGNVVAVDGHLEVIEYSDLPREAAERRASDGSLELWAGSIAVHLMAVEFLARSASMADSLPFHIAKKKVPHVDASGSPVRPEQPNAIKFERFIFDLLPRAQRAIVVEVDNATAFAPVINASGSASDTPESVERQMVAVARDWLREAGAEVADDAVVEISPRFALDAAELRGKIAPGERITGRRYFG